MNSEKLKKIKEVIKEYYGVAKCGIFFTRNIAGDTMTNIYEKEDISIDICYEYEYFEIFGLNEEEQQEIVEYYYSL